MLFDPLEPLKLPKPEDEADSSVGEADLALELLQAIYRNPRLPERVRQRAAIACLPFESPKLAVVASYDASEGFAAKLEAAIARTGRPSKLIEGVAQSVVAEPP